MAHVPVTLGSGMPAPPDEGAVRAQLARIQSSEPLSRELRARSFVLAVQRDVVLEMSKRSKTSDPGRRGPHEAAVAKGTVGALKELIGELLADGRPTIERVAPRLGMSVRTLQRRLQDLGQSFEDIVDETRRGVAIERLTAGDTSITETAFLLGYSDLSHFTRAFRRWTGATPRDFAATRHRQDNLKS